VNVTSTVAPLDAPVVGDPFGAVVSEPDDVPAGAEVLVDAFSADFELLLPQPASTALASTTETNNLCVVHVIVDPLWILDGWSTRFRNNAQTGWSSGEAIWRDSGLG